MKRLHLVCNAHLDPMWLWEWEEGASAAVATFRCAAAFCEEFEHFIFNHNEAVLYQWTEEYEPELFARIQELVRQGRWHIMGGWHIQPDCNMPSGETMIRHMLTGRRYFLEKFGSRPTTAINFDSFGHSRGLVQLLKKAGYDAYLHTRPSTAQCGLELNDYVWIGYDGSEVLAHRSPAYNTRIGQAASTVEECIVTHKDEALGLHLWGVGDHGGGPSRKDLLDLAGLMLTEHEWQILHSTPEAYFAELDRASLPRHAGDVNPCSVGCYTSQVRIKQGFRRLENAIYTAEKMLSHAALSRGLDYPREALGEAIKDVMVASFHDFLPGSSIQAVEEAALRLLDHGLEITARLKSRAFHALAAGQTPSPPGTVPILIYNPHPYPVSGVFDCEFNIEDVKLEECFVSPTIRQNGRELPSQAEREASSIPVEFRKRVVFQAELAPAQMNRFDCHLETLPQRPTVELRAKKGWIKFETNELLVEINTQTGLVDRYQVRGKDLLGSGAFRPVVMQDEEDAWGNHTMYFNNRVGKFKLMSAKQAAAFAGLPDGDLAPVRVIEDGAARTVVEALFAYGNSEICQRYLLPKQGTEIQIELRVYWNEKTKLLKWQIPAAFKDAEACGQVMFGREALPSDGREAVIQKWVAMTSNSEALTFTCINDGSYGADFRKGKLRLSLLRSPGYSSHPFFGRPVMAPDRFSPRIDQGERLFRFCCNGGATNARMGSVDREALAHNERPYVLAHFAPTEPAQPSRSALLIDDSAVLVSAFKKAEDGDDYIIRLFEPTGTQRTTVVAIPALDLREEVTLGAFEVKTLRLDVAARTLREASLIEDL